jgi:DNA-binding FadR family transcriptional regulator
VKDWRRDSAPACDLASVWGRQPLARAASAAGESARTEAPASDHCARNVVADKLAHMVHVGLLEAGDELPGERDLCEVFGVARQTVRAALAILESRLMLAISHGRRSRVVGTGRLDEVDAANALKRLPERRAEDVFHALLLIDAEMASQTVRHVGSQALARIDALVALLPRVARDPLCYQMLEYEVRALVYGSCGNRLLADMAMDFYGYASRQRRRLLGDPQCLQRSVDLQVMLADGLRARDAHQVGQVMKEQVEALAALPAQEPCRREEQRLASAIDQPGDRSASTLRQAAADHTLLLQSP